MAKKLRISQQILYVPLHAEGDLEHPDVEAGFITSFRGDHAFCRYWSKTHPGKLRTTTCSELTPLDCLVAKDTVAKKTVDAFFAEPWRRR